MKLQRTAYITFFTGCILIAVLSFTPGIAQTVYVTKTGKKYHREYCQYLRLSKFSISLTGAIERGYTACLVCRPGTNPKSGGAASPANSQENGNTVPQNQNQSDINQSVTSRRCSAATKAGAQCKRMTTNASGRCWQHE